jgi:hypothetical protein
MSLVIGHHLIRQVVIPSRSFTWRKQSKLPAVCVLFDAIEDDFVAVWYLGCDIQWAQTRINGEHCRTCGRKCYWVLTCQALGHNKRRPNVICPY